MYILKLEVKHVSALYGHHQVFLFPLRFRYINYDVEISHPIIILVYNLYSETLREKEKPDDGHIRPKHVVLLLILEYTSFI